jgi:hypothetical protein
MVPLPNKSEFGLYGLPSNLEENRSAWEALWDDDLMKECVYGEMTENGLNLAETQARNRAQKDGKSAKKVERAKAEARQAVLDQRDRVTWWLLSILRPLWVIKGPVTCGKTQEGELYINGHLAESLWGEGGKQLCSFTHGVETYKHVSARAGGKQDPFV